MTKKTNGHNEEIQKFTKIGFQKYFEQSLSPPNTGRSHWRIHREMEEEIESELDCVEYTPIL